MASELKTVPLALFYLNPMEPRDNVALIESLKQMENNHTIIVFRLQEENLPLSKDPGR